VVATVRVHAASLCLLTTACSPASAQISTLRAVGTRRPTGSPHWPRRTPRCAAVGRQRRWSGGAGMVPTGRLPTGRSARGCGPGRWPVWPRWGGRGAIGSYARRRP